MHVFRTKKKTLLIQYVKSEPCKHFSQKQLHKIWTLKQKHIKAQT